MLDLPVKIKGAQLVVRTSSQVRNSQFQEFFTSEVLGSQIKMILGSVGWPRKASVP